MFIREQLKEKAKQNFRKNIWLCIGITFVFTLLTGSLFGLEADIDTQTVFFRVGLGNILQFKLDFIYLKVAGPWLVIISLLTLAYSILISNPLKVGHIRFYIENRNEPSHFETLFFVFGNKGYWNIVKIMLLKDIYIYLWYIPSLVLMFLGALLLNRTIIILAGLLAIPSSIQAIKKLYEYYVIPYILAENPMMDSHDAFIITKELTFGYKWNIFVLELSFILWLILAAITFGIASLYTNVYIHATTLEAYYFLKEEGMKKGIIEPDEKEEEYVESTIDNLY
ncbi:MAG: DUF975 family protein [Traorella sp.]